MTPPAKSGKTKSTLPPIHPFAAIVGNEPVIRVLQRAVKNSEVASAYLFFGPEGVGKRTTALAFARALLCTNRSAQVVDACGACPNCRRVEGGNYPDLHFVEPIIHDNKKKREINIDDIRELIGELAYSAYEGGRKIVIIDEVDLMNLIAANAFLKTLEEPPRDTVIILITANPRNLLPTIISRCQEARFTPLLPERMVNFAMERMGQAEENAQVTAALSRGAPGVALTGSLDKDREIRDNAFALIIGGGEGTTLARSVRYAESLDRLSDKGDADKTLDAAVELIRDLLTVKTTGKCDTLIHIDIAADIVRHSRKYTRRGLIRGYRTACQLMAARRLNLNPLLVLSLLAMELRR